MQLQELKDLIQKKITLKQIREFWYNDPFKYLFDHDGHGSEESTHRTYLHTKEYDNSILMEIYRTGDTLDKSSTFRYFDLDLQVEILYAGYPSEPQLTLLTLLT